MKSYGIGESPRPFLGKGSNAKRCSDCLLREGYCVCSFKAIAQANCEIWLVMHRKETFKPTNTGRLIADVLPQHTKIFHWDRTEPDPKLIEHLDCPQYQPCLIFPNDGEGYEHRVVNRWPPSVHHNAQIPAFIILDGTWRQARRMFRLSPFFQSLPVLAVQPQQHSGYRLRSPDKAEHLCTAEVAIALLLQSGNREAAEKLLGYFEVFNRFYDLSRRSIPLDGKLLAKP